MFSDLWQGNEMIMHVIAGTTDPALIAQSMMVLWGNQAGASSAWFTCHFPERSVGT
jgi:hypothetical protein